MRYFSEKNMVFEKIVSESNPLVGVIIGLFCVEFGFPGGAIP